MKKKVRVSEDKILANVPADLKREVRIKAARQGVSISAVVRQLLFGWVKDDPDDGKK
jgi:plasmid stability protein